MRATAPRLVVTPRGSSAPSRPSTASRPRPTACTPARTGSRPPATARASSRSSRRPRPEGRSFVRLDAVNVGRPRTLAFGDVDVETAIWKAPVEGRRRVGRLNVEGDRQADLRVHGGPDKAVYAYASESRAWWGEHLGLGELPLGMFGENFSTSGV